MLHAKQNRVVFEYISIVRRRACWAPAVILSTKSVSETRFEGIERYRPIRFVEDDDFVPTRWKGDLLLSERFDFVPNDIDSSTPGVSDYNSP